MSDNKPKHNPNEDWHGETSISTNTTIAFRHVTMIGNIGPQNLHIYINSACVYITDEKCVARFTDRYKSWQKG